MSDNPELDIKEALDKGLTPRFSVEKRIFGEGWLIRAEAVDPVYPRRKPARLFPIADVLVVDSPGEGLRLLAEMFDRAITNGGEL